MTTSLYHAAHDMQQRIALCVDHETGEIDTDKLDLIEGNFQERAVAVVAVYKGKGHTVDTLKSYMAEITERIAKEQRDQERLKDYLHAAMIMSGTEKIKSDDGLLTATLYRDRDESVELDEGVVFDAALCTPPKPPAPSKTLIKAAILKGEAVAGARIVRRDRLAIK